MYLELADEMSLRNEKCNFYNWGVGGKRRAKYKKKMQMCLNFSLFCLPSPIPFPYLHR